MYAVNNILTSSMRYKCNGYCAYLNCDTYKILSVLLNWQVVNVDMHVQSEKMSVPDVPKMYVDFIERIYIICEKQIHVGSFFRDFWLPC